MKIIIRVPVGLPYFFNMSEIYGTSEKKLLITADLLVLILGTGTVFFYQVLPVDVAPVELEIPELVQHIQVLIQSI